MLCLSHLSFSNICFFSFLPHFYFLRNFFFFISYVLSIDFSHRFVQMQMSLNKSKNKIKNKKFNSPKLQSEITIRWLRDQYKNIMEVMFCLLIDQILRETKEQNNKKERKGIMAVKRRKMLR